MSALRPASPDRVTPPTARPLYSNLERYKLFAIFAPFCSIPSVNRLDERAYPSPISSVSFWIARDHNICTAPRVRPIRSATSSNGRRCRFLSRITSR